MASFAVDDNGGIFSFLNFISEQISVLKEKILELVQKIKNTELLPEEVILLQPTTEKKIVIPTPKTPPKITSSDFAPPKAATPFISVPVSAPEIPPKEATNPQLFPRIDIKANGSDGPVIVTGGDIVNLSWDLSDHNWSYCDRFGSWEGTLPIGNGFLKTEPASYNKTYNIFCYIGSEKHEDSVTVLVTQPQSELVKSYVPPPPSYSLAPNSGFESCSLSVSPPSVTIGKDAIEATWIVDSGPKGAFFYWRGKDNGVDIGTLYGGKTKRTITFNYNPYSVKYERYAEMVLDSSHIPNTSFVPGCTTNTVIFEVK